MSRCFHTKAVVKALMNFLVSFMLLPLTKCKLDSLVISSWECVKIDGKFQPFCNIINKQLIILDGIA